MSKNDDFLKAVEGLKNVLGPEKSKKASRFFTGLKKIYEDNEESCAQSGPQDSYPLPIAGSNSYDYYLFSDGGCRGNPGPGAWGIVLQDHQGKVVYEGRQSFAHTTNNRMELSGAIRALEKAAELGAKSVYLVSDSKYVLDGLKSWLDGWKRRGWKKADKKPPENLELWQEIDQMREKFDVLDTLWVKGHAGHPQNERCDELVNLALDHDEQLT